MKQIAGLAITLLVLSGGGLRAEPQSQPNRCAIVCPTDSALDAEHCTCRPPPKPKPGAHCALACPQPGKRLDADRCKCVDAP